MLCSLTLIITPLNGVSIHSLVIRKQKTLIDVASIYEILRTFAFVRSDNHEGYSLDEIICLNLGQALDRHLAICASSECRVSLTLFDRFPLQCCVATVAPDGTGWPRMASDMSFHRQSLTSHYRICVKIEPVWRKSFPQKMLFCLNPLSERFN